MTELGRELAEARQRAGLSVEELSHRTKISVPTLLAIERNQMNTLPGGLYARSMLRAYAREVGIDPEDVVKRFRAEVGEQVDPLQMLDRMASASDGSRVERLHSADIDAADRRRAWRNAAIFALVLLLGGAFFFGGERINSWAAPLVRWARSARPVATNVSESLTQPADAAPQPVGTTSVAPASVAPTPPGPADNSLRLEIQPREQCWLSATADGQRVIYRLLNAGERAEVEAKEAIDLRVGDPSVFAFKINGAVARAPGVAGVAANLHLTPKNYHEYLSP
jgi:cytoskeleton protein RodZ